MAWISVRCSEDSGADVSMTGRCILEYTGRAYFPGILVGAKSRHHLFDIAGHGDGDRVGGERDVHFKIGVASGLNSKFIVVRLKGLYQVISIILSTIANAEIVDHKAEHNVACFVLKETGGVDALMVSVLLQVRDEA